MITVLCLFVIFNFRFIRIVKESFKLIIFVRIKFSGIDNKFFEAIIFGKFKLGLILFLTETILSFERIRVSKRGLFGRWGFEIAKTVNMIGMIGCLIIIVIVSVESEFFIFVKGIGFVVESELIFFDRVGDFIIEWVRSVLWESFLFGHFSIWIHR